MKYLLALLLLSTSLQASSRLYIDSSDLEISEDTFYIHLGGNMYSATGAIFNDESGLYILETNMDFQKKWKCPYCHMMWPVKSPCKNAECPSKYSKVKKCGS